MPPAHVIEEQHGVATRGQLVAEGFTDSQIRANVRARRWVQLTPILFVLHNGPLTLEQQWWAATLAVGPLAGRTALESWGVKNWVGDGVEVLRDASGPVFRVDLPQMVDAARKAAAP